MVRGGSFTPSIALAWSVIAALAIAAADLAAGPPDDRDPIFTNEALARGIEYVVAQGDFGSGYGCGAGFVDLDGDHDPDVVLLGRADDAVGVYENDGTGVFTDRTGTCGIAPLAGASGVSAADYDGDGDLDLYLSSWNAPNVLLRNDGGFQFTDVTVATGVGDDGPGHGCAWSDYDLDGDLDLYVSNRAVPYGADQPNRLYRQEADGTFTDVAAELGVDAPEDATFHAVFFDMDRDGDDDLYLSTDKGIGCAHHNRLYENLGGIFEDVTDHSGTAACIDSMGVAVGDFDGNGLQDLYCTNIPGGNPLFMAQGENVYLEQSVEAGVASFATGWGAWFLDYDNNGTADLFVCNNLAPNRLYRNDGVWPCPDMAAALGLDDTGDSYCTAIADIDDDGDLDLLVQNHLDAVRLFVNAAAEKRRWAKIALVDANGHAGAIGAQVDVRVGQTWQLRQVFAGTGYKSQNELIQHVGLGTAAQMDEVVVEWPGGATRTLFGLAADRTWWIAPPGVGGDATADGVVDTADLVAVILAWGPCPSGPATCLADLTGDGVIDVQDLVAVIASWD